MPTFTNSVAGLAPAQLQGGFFEGWPSPPSAGTHLAILRGSTHVVLALEGQQVVGFVTAISDGVVSAYIPLLEVLPAWRGQGLGQQLVKRVLDELGGLYMVDLVCDEGLAGFYAEHGFRSYHAMVLRRYDLQSGRR